MTSTGTDNQNGQAEAVTQLAHRAGDGIEVLLVWDRGEGGLRVVVDDLRTGDSFELVVGNGRQALDAFYHPFAHAAAQGIVYHSDARSGSESAAGESAAQPSSLQQH